jgi:hypothetical protein
MSKSNGTGRSIICGRQYFFLNEHKIDAGVVLVAALCKLIRTIRFVNMSSYFVAVCLFVSESFIVFSCSCFSAMLQRFVESAS